MRDGWKKLAYAVSIGVVMGSAVAYADDAESDGPWEVRLRAVELSPANKSDAIPSLAVPANAIHINSKWLPDLDFEYFFAPHWSSELILTYPQSQTVTVEQSALGGPVNIGTFKHLPPILTVKYNFLPDGVFRPYVGVGANLTLISNVNLAVPTVGALSLNSTSVGPALQAGFDVKVAPHWFLNADVKWAKIGSDVKLGSTKVSHVSVDPYLFGVGIGYRFGGGAAPVAAAAATAVAAPVAAPPPPPAPAPQAAPPPPPPPPAPAPKKLTDETVLKGVNFETGSAKLTKDSSAVLDAVASSIAQCKCSHVDVRGYTDATGKAAFNKKLSERRAAAVQAYLEAHGVSKGVLSAEGFGEENPIASNDTADGRAENRRVTVQFTQQVEK